MKMYRIIPLWDTTLLYLSHVFMNEVDRMVLVSRLEDVPTEKVELEDVSDTYIQWLITKEKQGAPNFAMRRFVMKPGGRIGLHHHPWEHEIFILSGEGVVMGPEGMEKHVVPGNFVFVPPDEIHGYRNDGTEDFVFLCMIPYKD